MVENRRSKRSHEERGRGRRPGTLAAERLEARAMLATVSAGAFTRPAGLPPATEPTAYFDVTTGELELDPVGLNLSLFNFTYNTTATNITGASPGPFRYPLGTVQQAVSTADQARTLPAGGWSLVTTFPARVAGAITLTNTATLATSGPNSASTNGWFNKPWSFGSVIDPQALTVAEARRNFVSITSTDAGLGPGRGLFHYTVHGAVGNKYGPVIVVASGGQAPTPSIVGMAGDEILVSRTTGSSLTNSEVGTLPAGVTWVNHVSGDFNADGRTDVASQTDAGGWWVTTTPASGPASPRLWATLSAFQFPTVGDFDADGRDDIAIRNEANGSWRVLTSTGSEFTSSRFGRWNAELTWSNVLAGDFNNDGRDDVVGQRSDGAWVVAASTGTSFTSTVWTFLSIGQFGTVGDFNADGRDDVAVRNANNGSWRVLSSSGTGFTPLKFGSWDAASSWSNVRAGDFNGDGRTDLLGQRADGTWFVSTSGASGFTTAGWTVLAIGQFATVGDFNADGLDDVAVRNPANGAWRLLSGNGTSFTATKLGDWPSAKAWSRAFAARA
jgi:hypothetical protein